MVRVVILNDASVARGGATGLALLQANALLDRGIETVFFAADREPNQGLQARGATLYNAGSDPLMKAPPHVAATRGLYNRAVGTAIRRMIAEQDSPETVYHVHSWSKTLTPAAFAALRPVAARTFIHAHDFFLACPNGGFMDYRAMQPCNRVPLSVDCLRTNCDKRSFAQKGWRVTRQMILRRTLPRDAPWAGILMIHPGMADFLTRSGYPPDRLHALRNPAQALSDRRVCAEDNSRFLFIGRVEAEKGVEELVAAAAQAGVSLTVAGDGPLLAGLRTRFPAVRFTGWLDRAGLLREVAEARALVMPSRYPEPFGLVAAEASLSGLPVILSEPALLGREVVEHGIGWTCNTLDHDAFARVLEQVGQMTSEKVKVISQRAFDGQAGLCSTTDGWIDAQLAHYARVIGTV